ncbi:hypothetical protein CBOS2020_31180 [Clostridium botulinum]|nr:hypothetical protein CBOS2020_31180 [Clostridium botulinum]
MFGLASRLFSKLTHKMKEIFSVWLKSSVIRSAIGGFIVIALVYIVGTRDFLGLSLSLISDSFTKSVDPFAFFRKDYIYIINFRNRFSR